MAVLYIVVPLAVIFAGVAIGVFIWATRSGQFDDTQTPGVRILFDDEDAPVRDDSAECEGPVQSSGR